MQLHKILCVIGFFCFVIGVACMDSRYIFTPVTIVIIGMCLLIWAAYEDGQLRKRK